MLELILGGARSGKSRLAVARAAASGREVIFLATAQPCDAEMRERIERHRHERPAHWATREAPVYLASAVRAAPRDAFIVIDCLTLWLANVLFAQPQAAAEQAGEPAVSPCVVPAPAAASQDKATHPGEPAVSACFALATAAVSRDEAMHLDEAAWARERDALLSALAELSAQPSCAAVLVSNEVGLGIVPETPAGRRFRDEQGRLNQQLAAACDRVTFVAAGLPLTLKPAR